MTSLIIVGDRPFGWQCATSASGSGCSSGRRGIRPPSDPLTRPCLPRWATHEAEEGRMASRDGPMVSGTDGSDFLHRETVAPHYQIRWETRCLTRQYSWHLLHGTRTLFLLSYAPSPGVLALHHGLGKGLQCCHAPSDAEQEAQASPGRRKQLGPLLSLMHSINIRKDR